MRDRQLTTSLSLWTGYTCGLLGSARPHDCTSLSAVLETGRVPPRYCLSPKACAGILRRAKRRGKELPPMLRRALEEVAALAMGPEDAAEVETADGMFLPEEDVEEDQPASEEAGPRGSST